MRQHQDFSRLHRADTCAWSRTGASAEPLPTRQVSARFRPRTRLTRQLCTRSTPLPFNPPGYIATPLRSDGRKLARQSGTDRARPKDGRCGKHWPRDFRPASKNSPRVVAPAACNTARGYAYRQDKRPRGFARQDTGNSREHGHIPDATLRWRCISPPEKWPTSLIKPNWSDTSPPGYVRVCRSRPCNHRVAARALRSAVEESDSLASRWRDCAGNESADPAKMMASAAPPRLRCHAGMLPGQNTRAVIYKAAPFAVSRWRVTLGKRVPAVSRESLRADGPVH